MRKAIYVDGANLFYMARALGISRIDYRELHKILTQEIGTPTEDRPFITVSKTVKDAFVSNLENIGFTCLRYTPNTGEDDALIMKHIRNLDARTKQIVLVSSDQDYLATLIPKEGAEIFWVGLETMKSSIINVSGFDMINLGKYKERLSLHHLQLM